MCGIAGVWGQADDGRVGTMLAAMKHRGPDGEGLHAFAGGAIGMVRLALVDLSPRGQQPMWSPAGDVAIVFNGEIYDHHALRAELVAAGHSFRSTSDTEVVLHAYLAHGDAFVQRLRGMYALAVCDFRGRPAGATPRLLLARDVFGMKPLHVTGDERGLGFASELKALVAARLAPVDVDRDALTDYLIFGFVPQPRTMLAGVRMLEPGAVEVYEPGQPVRRSLVAPWAPARPRPESFAEAAAGLRQVLQDSIRLHALADAPIGVFLSGGIDSALVAALMREHNPRLRAYTLGFPEVPGLDETRLAASTARHLGIDLTRLEVTDAEVAAQLPEFASALDQPSVDGLNTYLVSRRAARDVKGVLSGLGGDEWFAGYPVAARIASDAREGGLRQLAGRAASQLPPALLRGKLATVASWRSAYGRWLVPHSVFPQQLATAMTGRARPPAEEQLARAIERVVDPAGESALGVACALDADVYMRSQLLRDCDATSMAHSLELRMPLVDREVASFARHCADAHKLDPAASPPGKRVLLAAMQDLLPADIATRPKRGFSLPYEQWLGGAARPLATWATDPATLREHGLLDPAVLGRLTRGPGRAFPRTWSLIILHLWHQALRSQLKARA
jgi:asparagine synthase (glutamine-hydrolysing)